MTPATSSAARLRPAAADLGPDRPEKLRTFARLIEQGMTMVTLDARREGVRVPPHLAQELMLNLNFSLRFGIDDFTYDDDGVRASLSFNKMPFLCDIPWSSVYQLTSTVNADRMVWPDSLPVELSDRVPPQVRPRSARPPAPAPVAIPTTAPGDRARKTPHSEAPDTGAPDADSSDADSSDADSPDGTEPTSARPAGSHPTTNGRPPDGDDPDDGGPGAPRPRPTRPRPTLRRVK
jgi:stringent starvation protein B